MHLISGGSKDKAKNLKSDSNSTQKTADPNHKNVWNRNSNNSKDSKVFLSKKNDHRFNKNNSITAPPPLNLKSNPANKPGNASVAFLKTGPMSPHTITNSHDHVVYAVKKKR
jgi:hypothetical protein